MSQLMVAPPTRDGTRRSQKLVSFLTQAELSGYREPGYRSTTGRLLISDLLLTSSHRAYRLRRAPREEWQSGRLRRS